jgi:hypothetical protein
MLTGHDTDSDTILGLESGASTARDANHRPAGALEYRRSLEASETMIIGLGQSHFSSSAERPHSAAKDWCNQISWRAAEVGRA